MKNITVNKLRIIAVMLCAVVIVCASHVPSDVYVVNAATQQEIDEAKQKKENAKEDMQESEQKKDDALAQYEALEQQIVQTEHEVSIVEEQIAQTKNDITKKEEEIKKAEDEYNAYNELFKKRARAMYESSDLDYLEIVFGAEDFSDLLSKIEIISQLMTYDQAILTQMTEIKNNLIAAKVELEEILKVQEENMKNLEKRKEALNVTLAEKSNLIKQLEKDLEQYKKVFEAAEAAEAALIAQNQGALSYAANPVQYVDDGNGFAWPVPSTKLITSYYGYRIHPVYGSKRFHSGIDIGASYGVDIIAAADGVVSLATTNGGYGKCVIINHGSGITTLYGHNSTLLVSYGQQVKRGQVIAKAGSTGVSTGPHLHYEVRKNGSTTDPMQYYQ